MAYLTFETETYDYPESDRVRDYQPEYRTPGEDDMWADHTKSCEWEAKERKGKWTLEKVLPIRTEQPLDHDDLETMDIYGNDLEAARKERETTDAAMSKGTEPDLTEETTRTVSDPPSILTPTMRRARFIAATPTPAVMRVDALRRMYRRTKSEANRAYIAQTAQEVKASEPTYVGQEIYARLLAEKNAAAPKGVTA